MGERSCLHEEENKAIRWSQVETLNVRCQSGASSWFINPKGRVMGGWWAPPVTCSGKTLVVSDVAMWWDSEMVSFPCVIGTSCILFPSWSCCSSLSYCFCKKHILLRSFKYWDSSCCKELTCVPVSFIHLVHSSQCLLLFCYQVSHSQVMSTSLLFQKSLYHKVLKITPPPSPEKIQSL